jgi:hypothetical protein
MRSERRWTCLLAATLCVLASPALCATAHSKAQVFAHVASNGSIIYQHGVTQVTHPATGSYCILPSSPEIQAGIATGIVAPSVTLDYSQTPDILTVVSYGGANNNICPNANYMAVYSYYVAPGQYTAKDAGFELLWD